MSSLSQAIIKYSGNNKEGLIEYRESAKKDFQVMTKLLGGICLLFGIIELCLWGLYCLGIYQPSNTMDAGTVTDSLSMMLIMFIGGFLVGLFNYREIDGVCKEQIAKIEYAEQFERE